MTKYRRGHERDELLADVAEMYYVDNRTQSEVSRAIGMTRRQTRSMVRLEAGVVSLFGALLGVVVGLAFGWVAVIAIPDSITHKQAALSEEEYRAVQIAQFGPVPKLRQGHGLPIEPPDNRCILPD